MRLTKLFNSVSIAHFLHVLSAYLANRTEHKIGIITIHFKKQDFWMLLCATTIEMHAWETIEYLDEFYTNGFRQAYIKCVPCGVGGVFLRLDDHIGNQHHQEH